MGYEINKASLVNPWQTLKRWCSPFWKNMRKLWKNSEHFEQCFDVFVNKRASPILSVVGGGSSCVNAACDWLRACKPGCDWSVIQDWLVHVTFPAETQSQFKTFSHLVIISVSAAHSFYKIGIFQIICDKTVIGKVIKNQTSIFWRKKHR